MFSIHKSALRVELLITGKNGDLEASAKLMAIIFKFVDGFAEYKMTDPTSMNESKLKREMWLKKKQKEDAESKKEIEEKKRKEKLRQKEEKLSKLTPEEARKVEEKQEKREAKKKKHKYMKFVKM